MKEIKKMDRKIEEAMDLDDCISAYISICEKGFYSNDFCLPFNMKDICSKYGGRLN